MFIGPHGALSRKNPVKEELALKRRRKCSYIEEGSKHQNWVAVFTDKFRCIAKAKGFEKPGISLQILIQKLG